MSKEMETVIGWLQKSTQLSSAITKAKEGLLAERNLDTTPENINERILVVQVLNYLGVTYSCGIQVLSPLLEIRGRPFELVSTSNCFPNDQYIHLSITHFNSCDCLINF